MTEQKQVKAAASSSKRLTEKNFIWIRKIVLWGRAHPKERKIAVAMLVLSIIWFYLLSALSEGLKKYVCYHKARIVMVTCLVIGLLSLMTAVRPLESFSATGLSNAKINKLISQMQKKSKTAENLEDVMGELSSDLSVLHKENPDCVAYLLIKGAGISYPVMQHLEDEDYYLNHGFNSENRKNGCLILDNDSDLTLPGANLIIHGHHLKNGEMFGNLMKYTDQAFGEENNSIELITLNGIRTYQLYTCFYSKVYYEDEEAFKYYQYFGGTGTDKTNEKLAKANFYAFCNNTKMMSQYDTQVTAQFGDEFITLSTCSYHTENGRFVVVGKRIYQ